MKNMKKLLVLVLGLTVGYQLQADKESALSALVSKNSHYCKCKNNSLETLSCASSCSKSGYSGKYTLTPTGVACICNNGTVETTDCDRSDRCSPTFGSGFSGETYSVSTGELEKNPTTVVETTKKK